MKNVVKFDLEEFNKLVETEYWNPYHFQQQDWCKQRWVFEFSVPNNEWDEYEWILEVKQLDKYESTMWVDFIKWQQTHPIDNSWQEVLKYQRYFYPSIYPVVNDLFMKWIIPEWDYLINIDW